jgi:hypothetical protein
MASSLTTFKFDGQILATMNELKKSTNATSRAEVVRRAITLLKLIQDAKANGEKIVVRAKNAKGRSVERELILP